MHVNTCNYINIQYITLSLHVYCIIITWLNSITWKLHGVIIKHFKKPFITCHYTILHKMTSNYVIITFNKIFYNKLHKKYTRFFFQLQSEYMLMEWARKYYEIPKELHVRDFHPNFCIWGVCHTTWTWKKHM